MIDIPLPSWGSLHPPVLASRRSGSALLAGSLLALSACATLPAPLERALPKAATDYSAERSFAEVGADWPADKWWTTYRDSQLAALIDEALAGAPDLRAAGARIARAEAVAAQAGARLLPSVDANGSVQANRESYNLGFPAPRGWNDSGRTTLDFNWELDFWGRNRAAVAAATSEALAARAEGAAARLALSTSIASAYADLAALFADRDAVQEAVLVRRRTAELMRKRVDIGLENEGAAQRAASARAAAEAELAAVEEALALNRHRIAALLGAGPDRGLTIERPAPVFRAAAGLPANLPAELIGRRPEVVAARLRSEATAKRIKVARAAFYPNINLAAFIGLQSLNLANFAKGDALVGSAGPAISLPIFHGGQLRANYHSAEADYALSVAQYDAAVAQALRDVADAAASRKALSARLARTTEASASAEAAWEVAKQRYEGGLATYLDVLTAEDALIATRRGVAALETRAFALDVALVRALGGGFRAS